MKRMTLAPVTLLASVAIVTLSGCSAGLIKPAPGSPDMANVYQAAARGSTHFYKYQGQTHSKAHAVTLPQMPQDKANVNEKTLDTLENQFPTLPNPKSLMYLFGHYAGAGQLPVPGHFVAFSLYNRTYYALPSEIQRPINDGQFGG